MKTIIAGGRDIINYDYVVEAIADYQKSGLRLTEIVSGGALGVDKLGEEYAIINNIKLTVFEADWKNIEVPKAYVKYNSYGAYNVNAGMDRNEKMAEYAEALIAIWDGQSKGTSDMITRAKNHGLRLHIHRTDKGWWE